jgi:hypothetical protein
VLSKSGLELHPDKTRIIEFGRFAARNQKQRGTGKPETFDFLGFTHICGTSPKGRFTVLRQTIRSRMRAKLKSVKTELRRRMHLPIPEQGAYVHRVVRGYVQYYAVPTNRPAVSAFRFQVVRLWTRRVCRRSQKHRMTPERKKRLVARWVPPIRICHPYPRERLRVTTQGRSRMR